MIRAYITKINFSSGLEIALKDNSILIVLGPNNSGKSATLNNIKNIMLGENNKLTSLSSMEIKRISKIEDIVQEIGPPDINGNYNVNGNYIFPSQLATWWGEGGSVVGQYIMQRLISDLTTRARLLDCDPLPSPDFRNKYAETHPFHYMYRDPELEELASGVFKRAFKTDLIVHRTAGGYIPLYVGDRPVPEPGEERISLSYATRVEHLARLEEQGDGMRSFVSISARVMIEGRPIQLIDEPEAFLHPPQARLIAETVAEHSVGRQTIIATHSSDIVQGLLSEHASRVSVVRLTRKLGKSTAHHLSSEQITALWRDPILRFSNILDGLFHDGVIVTEADADCRFYEAIMNSAVAAIDRPDIHYTYSGGKDRLPTVISALVALKVPVVTLADFDVLNAENPLRKIFEAHGGTWSDIESDWKAVKSAIEAKEMFLSASQFRSNMNTIMKSISSVEVVPKNVLSDVRKLARKASPWDNVKSSGVAAVPPGSPTKKTLHLLATLAAHGIFVATNGEMEGWCRSIDGHGPRWVEEALKRDLGSDTEFAAVRMFATNIAAYLTTNDQKTSVSQTAAPEVKN